MTTARCTALHHSAAYLSERKRITSVDEDVKESEGVNRNGHCGKYVQLLQR
jgi:hypothetical protein